jgi:hypothetical protein
MIMPGIESRNQGGREHGTRRVAHHCTWFERRYNRLPLLDARPATPLGTGQYLDGCIAPPLAPV